MTLGLVRPADPQLAMARGGIEVGDGDSVYAAGGLDPVAQRDGVEVASAEGALPLVAAVMQLRQVERGVFGDERPGPVSGHVTASDAQPDRGLPGLGEQLLGVGERRG